MEANAEKMAWSFQDETEYTFVKMRYEDRQKLVDEMVNKRKAFQDTKSDDPLYHRMAVSAEMARLRADLAYIVGENVRLKNYIETIGWLHDQIGVLQGAYSHAKMLAEQTRISYDMVAKALNEIKTLKEELTNEIASRSDRADGPEGDVLPRKAR